MLDLLLNNENVFKQRSIQSITKIYSFIIMILFGIIFKVSKPDNIDLIYKKYLGSNYILKYDENYSSIISNHISWTVKLKFNLRTF